MLDLLTVFRLMTQVISAFFCDKSEPGVGEGSQLARYPSRSESQASGGKVEGHLLEPSGGAGGHLVGTWRRLQDLNTRLTPIHLVRERKYLSEQRGKRFLIMNLNTSKKFRSTTVAASTW